MTKKTQLGVERLEQRDALALFGVPWVDPTHLTLSFAPDGAGIAGTANNIHASLGKNYTAFRDTILKAAQTWMSEANLSISVVADSGTAFGAAGPSQHDSRFGDIRIGGRPFAASASALAVPPDLFLSGTWAGDVVFNTAIDWSKPNSHLFNIALHEVGHALGLEENNDPQSVMVANLEIAPSALSTNDVAAIQALYGPRVADQFEGATGNGTFQTATPLDVSEETPAFAFGNISTRSDSDIYRIQGPENGGAMTIRVLTKGVSLLHPRVTVLDGNGGLVAQGSSVAPLGGVVSLTFQSTAGAVYFVKVQGTPNAGVFGVGRYGLAVTTPASSAPVTQIDAFLRGPYESLSVTELQSAWDDPTGALVHDDGGTDNGVVSAVGLTPNGPLGRFLAVGSLNGPADANYYRVVTPSGSNATITAVSTSFGSNGVIPWLGLYDAAGNLMPSDIVANGAGGYAIQATGLQPNTTYVVRAAGTGASGNYQLVVDTRNVGPLVTDMASGSLTTPSQGYDFYNSGNALFHFALAAGATSAVRMLVTNDAGQTVFQLTAGVGQTASGAPVLLLPGHYTVQFAAQDPLGPMGVTFSLRGAVVSDPVGPVLVNPATTPQYIAPKPANPKLPFLYPGGHFSALPFFWIPKIL